MSVTSAVARSGRKLLARWLGATAAVSLGVFFAPVSLAWGTTGLTVSITSPTAGATIDGTITLTALASEAPNLGSVDSITFYDGANKIGYYLCTTAAQPCAASVTWDGSGLSGQHSLTAVAVGFLNGAQTTSAPVAVTVVSPPPTVSITGPTAGSTVSGAIAVTATAATDASQSDYPTTIVLSDGVNALGDITCEAQSTCQGSVKWNATGLTGPHTLTATVQTHTGLTATSTPVMVTVLSPGPTVRILSPAAGASLGRKIHIGVSGRTDPTQVDYPTSIKVYDGAQSIGVVRCQGQETCTGSVSWDARKLTGEQQLVAVIRTHTQRSAMSAPVDVGVAIKKIMPRCTLSSLSVAVGQPVRGQCTLTGAPTGTYVAVQYRSNGRWLTVVSGDVSRGRFVFTLLDSQPTTTDLWVFVSGTSRTRPARTRIGTLRVH